MCRFAAAFAPRLSAVFLFVSVCLLALAAPALAAPPIGWQAWGAVTPTSTPTATPAADCPSAQPSWSEDFDDGVANCFVISRSPNCPQSECAGWQVSEGRLEIWSANDMSSSVIAVVGHDAWTDYSASVDLNIAITDDGGAGALLAAGDAQQGYNWLVLYERDDYIERSGLENLSYAVANGVWYHLRIDVRSSGDITYYLDGQGVGQASGLPSSGPVRLWVGEGTFLFDNLRVVPLSMAETPFPTPTPSPTPTPAVDVYVSKGVWSGTGLPGGEIEYLIAVGNQGNALAHEVVVTDTLPLSLTYISISGVEAFSVKDAGHTVVFTYSTIAVYYSEVYLRVRVSDAAQPGEALTNVVRASLREADVDPSNNIYTHTTTVTTPEINLMVAKSLLGQAAPGNNMDYYLDVRNAGNAAARDVIVTDTLPANVSYVSGGGWPFSLARAVGNTVVFTSSTLNPSMYQWQSIQLRVHVSDTVRVGDVLTNVAHISSPEDDTDPSDNVYTHTTTAVAPALDLTIDKQLSGSAASPGNSMYYTIYVYNQGNIVARNVIVTDTLPAGVTYEPDGFSGNFSPPTIGSNTLVFTITAISSGSAALATYCVRVGEEATPGDVLTNTATVSSSGVDVDPSNNTSACAATVQQEQYDLEVYKYTSGVAGAPGGTLSYYISVHNKIEDPARDVIITDTLPAKLRYLSSNADSVEVIGQNVIFRRGTLDGYAWDSVSLTARISETAQVGEMLTNTVRVTARGIAQNPEDDADIYTQAVAAPEVNLSAQKSLAGSQPKPGDEVDYTLSVLYSGNITATGVIVTDTLPAQVRYVSSQNDPAFAPAVVNGRKVVFGGGTLGGNYGEASFTVRVRISDTTRVSDTLTNTIAVSSLQADSDPSDNVYTHTVAVTGPMVDLSIEKRRVFTQAAPGGPIRYEVEIRNNGEITATNVVVNDVWDANLQLTSFGSSFPCDLYGNSVHCMRDTLPAGVGITIDMYMHVKETTQVGDTVLSQASVQSSEPDRNPSDNSDACSDTLVAPWVDLRLTKSLDYQVMSRPGEIVTYTLWVYNQGNYTVTHLILTDTLPSGLSYASASSSANPFTSPTVTGNQLVFRGAGLEGFASAYVSIRARVSDTLQAGIRLTNTATISCQEAEADYTNNHAQVAAWSRQRRGEPDPCGYVFRDSAMQGGPAYVWEEIASSGAQVWPDSSAYYTFAGPFALGFSFPFYGHVYSDLYVSSGGYLSFGAGAWDAVYAGGLPSPDAPANSIIPFGSILNVVEGTTRVYYRALSNPTRYVVTWADLVPYYDQTHPITFQVILYPSGRIVTQYRETRTNMASFTVGIQNADASCGVDYGTNITNGLAVAYYHVDALTLTPSGSVVSGDGLATFRAPAQLTQTLTITYTPLISPSNSTGEFSCGGIVFRLEARGASGQRITTLSTPLSLTLRYDPALLPAGMDEATIEVRRYDEDAGTWVPLTVLSRDLAGNTLTVLLDHLSEFGLFGDVSASTSRTLALRSGWNLISLPLAPENTAITQALASIAGRYDLAYAYDVASGTPWKKYNTAAPAFLNTLKVISETQGLWVRASAPVSLTITGTLPTSAAIALKQGWNLVGYPSQTTQPVTVALASITGEYDLVYAYDAASSTPWKKYNVSAPAFLNTLKEMGPGWGYWIRAKEDCTWTLP